MWELFIGLIALAVGALVFLIITSFFHTWKCWGRWELVSGKHLPDDPHSFDSYQFFCLYRCSKCGDTFKDYD